MTAKDKDDTPLLQKSSLSSSWRKLDRSQKVSIVTILLIAAFAVPVSVWTVTTQSNDLRTAAKTFNSRRFLPDKKPKPEESAFKQHLPPETPKPQAPPSPLPTSPPGIYPTLTDFWNGNAEFAQEVRVTFPGQSYDANYDYYYLPFGGWTAVQHPTNPSVVYYLAEHNSGTNSLIPRVYKSTDGGTSFTDQGSLFDVITDASQCPTTRPASNTSSVAHWYLDNKVYCLFQMREPHVSYHQGAYWIVYEGAAQARDGSKVLGAVMLKLDDFDNLPKKVSHGINFRQHPVLKSNYDGDLTKAGVQETSVSTPTLYFEGNSAYMMWAGAHPINSTWERVDSYIGHFSSSTNGPADCFNLFCFFIPDKIRIQDPLLPVGGSGRWDSKRSEATSLFKEGVYYYALYMGSQIPSPCADCPLTGLSMARSPSLSSPSWERKDYSGGSSVVHLNPAHEAIGGRLTKFNGQYHLYFFEHRPPKAPYVQSWDSMRREYRRTLVWK